MLVGCNVNARNCEGCELLDMLALNKYLTTWGVFAHLAQPPDLSPDKPSPSDGQAAADRHQIFEQIALERLRNGSDTSKPVSFLPLPVRLTALAAVTITGLGVVWSFTARIPVQVNGLASITPEVPVSSAIARVDGDLTYQVSGVGPDLLSPTQRSQNMAISNYWRENWETEALSYSRLNQLSLSALDNDLGQRLVMPESINNADAIDDLSSSLLNYQKLRFPGDTVIARIANSEAQQELDAIRLATLPKLKIDGSIIDDRRQGAGRFKTVATLLVNQRRSQQQELKEREALLKRLDVLWRKGFVSTVQLLQEQSLINGLRNQLLQLDRERINTKSSVEDQRQQAAQASLSSLQTTNQLQSALVSYLNKVYTFSPPLGMYIVSRSIRNGMQAKAGEELFTYSVQKPTLPGVIPVFVDAATSQQLNEGMQVLLTPKGISRAQYGGIPGVVDEVGKLPLPVEGIAAFAGGRTLAGSIQQSLPSSYLVRVKLQQAEPAYCQQMLSMRCYQWSTNRRPPFPVKLGTLADAQITVQYRRPIEFVMPALRQALGLVLDNN